MDLMDLIIARRIVLDAVRIVLEMRNMNLDPNLLENPNHTLVEVGLVTHEHRSSFRSVIVQRVNEEGYEIDPNHVPLSANDTLFTVLSALPGHSTKGNPA